MIINGHINRYLPCSTIITKIGEKKISYFVYIVVFLFNVSLKTLFISLQHSESAIESIQQETLKTVEYASLEFILEHSQLQNKEKLQMANIKDAAKRKIEEVNKKQIELYQMQNKIDVSNFLSNGVSNFFGLYCKCILWVLIKQRTDDNPYNHSKVS